MPLFRKGYVNVTEKTDIVVISHDIKRAVTEAKVSQGIVQVFTPLSTTAVALLENDPQIHQAFKQWVEQQIPATSEKRPDRRSGTGRNYAHLRAQIVGHSLQLPIAESKLQIGAWQEVLFFDFDDRIGRREFYLLVQGGS